jgi:hypothetical protein
MKLGWRHLLAGLFVVLLGGLWICAPRADVIFVANFGGPDFSGTVGKYTTAELPINPALISGLNHPIGIAVSGADLFVANSGSNTIGKYATDGVPINPALISGTCFTSIACP